MVTLNFRESKPIYEQIKDNICSQIVSGEMEKDEKLPSVRTLATSLSINPNTIQRAYNELEAEGYVYSIAGKGSFVADCKNINAEKKKELKTSFLKVVEELVFLGTSKEELISLVKEIKND